MTSSITIDELAGAAPASLDVPVCRASNQHVEVRADGDDGDESELGTMVGTFSTFGEWYEVNSFWEGHFIERIAKGAFKRTIKNRSDASPIRVLLEHGFDPVVGDKPLGVPEKLSERADGAYGEVPLFDTSYNRDLIPALRGGAYGQSFRFEVLHDDWLEPESEGYEDPGRADWSTLPQRTISEVRLIEFGPTVFPANPGTSAGMRSTTDHFYDALRRRDAARYDEALRRTAAARLPQVSATEAERTTPADDPSTPHPEDPPTGHSTGPHVRHSGTAPPEPSPQNRSNIMAAMTIEERTARQSEIRARLTEIDSEHSGAELPEEVRNEWDELNTEFDTHTRAITDSQTRHERMRRLADDPSNVERGSDPGPAVHRRPDNIYDLSEVRQRARSVDELGGLYRDNARRALEQASFHGVRREDAQANVERLLDIVDDEQGTLARRVLVTGSPTYQRAYGKVLASLSDRGLTAEEQRALSLGVGTDGGYAVPFQLDPTIILTSDGVQNPLRSIARTEQITGKEWQGVTSAGITVSRAAEGAEVGDGSPEFDQPTVSPKRVQGFVPFSVELDQDWAALQSEITRMLNDAKTTEEADAFVNGDATGNNPGGVLATLPASANVDVSGGGISSDNLYTLEEELPERWLANANFLANRSVYNAVRQLGNPDGADLWVRLGAGQPGELIGYPAPRLSTMPKDMATAGSRYLLFGDFRQFLIVDRVGMSTELVPHLFGNNGRPTGQRGIYAIWRNSSTLLVSGAFRVLNATV